MKAKRGFQVLWAIPVLISAPRRMGLGPCGYSINRCVGAVLVLLIFVGMVQAKYSGGTGEPNDPYQIATAADLIALGETPADYGKHFILMADIDLDPNLPGGKVFDKAVIAPASLDNWGHVQGTPFTGIFDGDGHAIVHLTITGESYLGLFGHLESGAEVKDLGVVDVNIYSPYEEWAIVGGLVGVNIGGNVTHCYSTGTISGRAVGGLAGSNDWGGTVSQCYSTAAVIGTGAWPYAGGLLGGNSGDVTNCYSMGTVSCDWIFGGLVGSNFLSGSLTNCYSNGLVNGTGGLLVGGLVGSSGATVTTCFWDTQTSGQVASTGGTGKTTGEMQTASTFLDAGWDFVGETANGTADIWWINEGKDYPRLWWESDEASQF